MSEPARLAGVIVGPGAAFDDIARKPRWLPPMLVVVLSSLLLVWFFNQRIGTERMLQQTFASNPRLQQLSPEQKAMAMEQQRKLMPVLMWVGPIVGTPLVTCIVAGVLLGIFNLAMGAGFKFGQIFSVTMYAWLPGALHSLLAVGVMHLKPPDDFDIQHPTAFNAGAFLPAETTPKWLAAIGGSLDLFSIWVIVLLAMGLHALDKKRSFAACLTGVLIPWAVYVLGKAGWAAIFG